MDSTPGDTADFLISSATEHGQAVTPAMLKQWRDAGLLPRPVQRPLGRGKGTATIYPAGTGAQLRRVLDLRSEQMAAGRRFDRNAAFWRLWWEGVPVDSALVRIRLGRMVDDWEVHTAQWRDLSTVPEERNAEIDRLAHGSLPEPLKVVRHRVGGSGPFAALTKTLLNVAGSGFASFQAYPGVDADDLEGDVRLGFDLDRVDWFSGDLRTDLSNLSRTLHPETLRHALDSASDDDLQAARDECRLLDGMINDASAIAAELGVTMFKPFALIGGYKPPPHHHGLFVVWWLSLRRLPAFRDRIIGLRMAAATLQAIHNRYSHLER